MANPKKRAISHTLLRDIMQAQKTIKKIFRNKNITKKFMVDLINGWHAELEVARNATGITSRMSRTYELLIAFAQEMDDQYESKYESYREQPYREQPEE